MEISRFRTSILALAAFSTALPWTASAIVAASPVPPETPRREVEETLHGETIVDPYRWLEPLELESPEVQEWTQAQNQHTREVLDQLPCHAQLVEQFQHLMSISSIGTPRIRNGLLFNTERREDQNQGVLMVRAHGQPPRILVDPNTLDEGGLVSLDWWEPSPDGNLLAFGISRGGDEMSTLHLLKTSTGEWTPLEISGKASISGWTPEGDAFLYSKLQDPTDPYTRTILWHTLGRHPRHDPVIATQTEPGRIPFGTLSRNGRWILLGLTDGWSSNDLWAVETAVWEKTGEIKRHAIATGLDAKFRPQAVLEDTLYMSTTLDAPNGTLHAVDLKSPQQSNWRTIIAQRENAVLQGVSRSKGMFVVTWEKDATTWMNRIRPDGSLVGPITLPGLGSASISTDPDTLRAYMSYTSYNEPRTVYMVDLKTDTRTVWARPEVPVDASKVVVRREWATSKDGTRIPMFLVHHSDVKPHSPEGPHPTLIYGYGGFNISLTPRFYATNFPWYDAGGVYVVANLRGGSEYGESWHRSGMLESKQNVFDDLYACAQHLCSEGWTDPEHLAVMGGSNGGLLTGVAVTQRPDLWSAVVSSVPLLDMLRYHQFLMARFWVPEYGSAEDPTQFQWLKAYSPYHNVHKGTEYPAVLINAGENDSRVHPLHARKFAAMMQWANQGRENAAPVLLRVEHDAGHGQGKPLSKRIESLADTWSFIMWRTGVCSGANP